MFSSRTAEADADAAPDSDYDFDDNLAAAAVLKVLATKLVHRSPLNSNKEPVVWLVDDAAAACLLKSAPGSRSPSGLAGSRFSFQLKSVPATERRIGFASVLAWPAQNIVASPVVATSIDSFVGARFARASRDRRIDLL